MNLSICIYVCRAPSARSATLHLTWVSVCICISYLYYILDFLIFKGRATIRSFFDDILSLILSISTSIWHLPTCATALMIINERLDSNCPNWNKWEREKTKEILWRDADMGAKRIYFYSERLFLVALSSHSFSSIFVSIANPLFLWR